jgi:phenylalanyl-tRNA synthetase alpha chain
MDSTTLQQWITRIDLCTNTTELTQVEKELFNKKNGEITVAMESIKHAAPEEKKAIAQVVNSAKKTLEHAVTVKLEVLKRPSDSYLKEQEPLDASLQLPSAPKGHLHVIPEFIAEVEEVFGRMGFDTFYGPELESETMNFDMLNIPATHPARDGHDTFWIDKNSPEAGKGYVLRTHTSPCQIRYMQSNKPPFRAIFPGKVYRKDADATHSPMFHQFEGLMIGEDITLANMKAVMMTAIKELINADGEFRFRTGYFPFVEPGLEVDMRWQGAEENSREGKWLEIVGCGMVHPNVLHNVGIDSTKYQGFAFGFGIERMIMIKHQIPDLRSFYDGTTEFLTQF